MKILLTTICFIIITGCVGMQMKGSDPDERIEERNQDLIRTLSILQEDS